METEATPFYLYDFSLEKKIGIWKKLHDKGKIWNEIGGNIGKMEYFIMSKSFEMLEFIILLSIKIWSFIENKIPFEIKFSLSFL